ncbi:MULTISPECIES: acyltransferase family protein [unclassified Sphingomonas]|uniref:acyltransferase family protein n=1 Tax=unclassified Sphingomonas TaxID=196159 RepID=UPI002150FE1D|nr:MULTISPECIES: acyltransferase family protein [unclassified Sphingomonas]MCR5871371.1 acyltransferase family protein [Sphingomonas sp. J344]UUY00327.1 acyltransferase family protein [Sphingomonas sp. J315]
MDDSGTPPVRLHALDAVRGGALLLGVAFHASLSFLPGQQFWVVRDAADPLIGNFAIVAHLFRMTLFFVIAGFFGRMLLERRGTGGFIGDRAKRIVAPLFAFWPILLAAIIATFVWGAAVMNGGTLPTDQPPPPPVTAATFPLTHLWFLYLLIWLYLAALALRGIAQMIDRQGRIAARIADPLLAGAIRYGAASVLLAVPGFLVLAGHPGWAPVMGIPTPDLGLIPNAGARAAYATAFFTGWMLQRQPVLLDSIAARWPLHMIGAVVITGGLLIQISGATFFAPASRPALAAAYMIASWCWTLGLLGAALRFLDAERPWVRYVADSSYWIYLVHLPVVAALQVLVYPVAAPALVKFAMVIAGASLILFASYHILVRRSFLGRWLNGRAYPRAARSQSMEVQTA